MSLDILFCDLEVSKQTEKIVQIGLVYKDKELKTTSLQKASEFIKQCDCSYIAGHNFINFDLKHLKQTSLYQTIKNLQIIDTLPLSLLFFNEKTIHALPKNYKDEDNFENDPVEDSKLTLALLEKVTLRFFQLDKNMQNILFFLLEKSEFFSGFFKYINLTHPLKNLKLKETYWLILDSHKDTICNLELLEEALLMRKVELAYILTLLTPTIEIKSHPPKILFDYPYIVDLQQKLCFDLEKSISMLHLFSHDIFGFDTFRTFDSLDANLLENKISQKQIIEASLKDESFLAILPTGGGKTFTFWLPAIIKAKYYKSLTVVISPLQALIEDHIKNFNAKVANFKAVAISGFMSPLERSDAIEQVANGTADILYIAPESLRSNMIFNILKNRYIERFVIDEAHCLSTWGNDFRQDYFYICEYIEELLIKKPFQDTIPISCFTATAKSNVIQDIREYFVNHLRITLKMYLANPERTNLEHKSFTSEKEKKYTKLLEIIDKSDGATLIYIPTSTSKCDEVAEKLTMDTSKIVKPFHSKIDSDIKMQTLKEFIENKVNIIVATTAFGMGVDKPDIKNVIHYVVSDSLENYAQEAGRGARNEKLSAYCPILFDEDDLDEHFRKLNSSKLTTNEINSIFLTLKKNKSKIIYKTPFELAKDSGWDVENNKSDFKTKVKTALLELERSGYIERKRNKTSFYADSIANKGMEKLHKALKESDLQKNEQDNLILILQTILNRGKPESIQTDELAHTLNISRQNISLAINQLKQMHILGDSKDLSANIKDDTIKKFNNLQQIELAIFEYLHTQENTHIRIRTLNEELTEQGCIDKNESTTIKTIVGSWKHKTDFLWRRVNRENDLWFYRFENLDYVKKLIQTRHEIAQKMLPYLLKKNDTEHNEICFSLKEIYDFLNQTFSIKEIDKTLLFLHELKAIELLSGRFINYTPMSIYKTDKFDSKRRYTQVEYKERLEKHYLIKVESIHIMGTYASLLRENSRQARSFLKDYFTLPYGGFKRRYKLLKEKISKPITQKRYLKIFSKLSDTQQAIIENKNSKAMMILAGPGSGKTKTLVHKIASLLLLEDVKPEHFMMLTFSKTAKLEFKTRLHELIGALSYDVEIQTFHSYALKLIAREARSKSILDSAIEEATRQITNQEISLPYISMLVLDEFQDINEKSFEFVKAIVQTNEEMKVLAVGDDDQCIMQHSGADIAYIKRFKEEFSQSDDEESYRQYELLCNYRSKQNIVKYSNDFIASVKNRYKQQPLYANTSENGEVAVYCYKYPNLITPLIKLIEKEDPMAKIAILAHTNEAVLDIYSLLKERNINAKYIIDRKEFQLKNIVELVFFHNILISSLGDTTVCKQENFQKALNETKKRFSSSTNLELVYDIIDHFLEQSSHYTLSEWLSFLDEIKLEDFQKDKQHILVSTIHKSKGLEFDKVFLLVQNSSNKEELKRLFYVGMTRAKEKLTILKCGDKTQNKECASYYYDDTNYILKYKTFTHIMSLKDIWLGFDMYQISQIFFPCGTKAVIRKIDSFDKLAIMLHGHIIAILSKNFSQILEEKIEEGFEFTSCIVEYVVEWKDKKHHKIFEHPLCKIVMRKKQ